MSNQVLLWSTLIIPWLSLFLMPRKDVKRFMSAGLFTAFMAIIASEVGVANGWWYFRETTYPLAVFSSFTYGLYPIIPMWILKYTYGRFGIFFLTETVGNAVSAFIVLPWVASRGIIDFPAELIAFIYMMIIALTLYGFQMWQEDALERSEKTEASTILRPAASKPLNQDEADKN